MSRDDRDGGPAWWHESQLLARLRRRAGRIGLGGAALLAGGCVPAHQAQVGPRAPSVQRAADVERDAQALGLQRAEGWDIGGAAQPLRLDGASEVDIAGTDGWRRRLDGLFLLLMPARADLQPFYVPTLFQSLIGPGNERLRAQLEPVHTPAMDEDYARGQALRELFEEAGWPADTAVVVDAPGTRAVAVAAALADGFDPVFTFGDWPHPLGVVPAQQTLAASLYYLPLFQDARQQRRAGAPPLFVLDSDRLLPYRDADTQFDNRYLARLPSAAQLAALGVRHVLYVNADGEEELDDLNHALVDLQANGIDVRTAALADFQRGAPVDDGPAPFASGGDVPDAWPASETYWYGGTPEWQVTFWSHYGWYRPSGVVWAGPRCHRHGVLVGRPVGGTPPHISAAIGRVTLPRATIFNAFHGAPIATPAFGHVAVRAALGDGRILAVRPGGFQSRPGVGVAAGGRSGSLGRAGGGHSG